MGDRAVSESALLNLQEPPTMANPKFVSTFHLKPKSLSAQYSTTILIKIGSSRRHHIEEIKYELRLTPTKGQPDTSDDTADKPTHSQPRGKHKTTRYKTEFEVQLHKGDMTLIKIHQPTKQCNNDEDHFCKTESKENMDQDINEPK